MESMSIPKLLAAMRAGAGDLSRREAARQAGIGQSTWSRYESGHREPSIGILHKIARGLGYKLTLTARERKNNS